jgi:hypothetical protein
MWVLSMLHWISSECSWTPRLLACHTQRNYFSARHPNGSHNASARPWHGTMVRKWVPQNTGFARATCIYLHSHKQPPFATSICTSRQMSYHQAWHCTQLPLVQANRIWVRASSKGCGRRFGWQRVSVLCNRSVDIQLSGSLTLRPLSLRTPPCMACAVYNRAGGGKQPLPGCVLGCI